MLEGRQRMFTQCMAIRTGCVRQLVLAICVREVIISSASLPIESNLCFSRHFRLHFACLYCRTERIDRFRGEKSVVLKSNRICLQLTDGIRECEQRSANLSFRSYRLMFITQLKKPRETGSNKMEVRNHAVRMFYLYLCREIHGPIILKLSFQ